MKKEQSCKAAPFVLNYSVNGKIAVIPNAG